MNRYRGSPSRVSTETADTTTYAFSAAILALLMWSGTAIANKFAVMYMSGLTAGVLRSMLAGVIALVIAMLLRLPRPSMTGDRLLLLGSGFASFAIWPTLASIGIERTTASHAAIIMAMIPVFTVLFASIANRRIPRMGWWVGAAVALLATLMLFAIPSSDSLEPIAEASLTGDLIILAGSIVCALGYIAGGKLSPRLGSIATTFWGLSAALVLLIPVFVLTGLDTVWTSVPTQGWLAVAWMTILSSLVGYGLWFYALGKGGIARIGSLQLAMPVVTIAAAALLLGEDITLEIMLITSMIVVGTWWAHRSIG